MHFECTEQVIVECGRKDDRDPKILVFDDFETIVVFEMNVEKNKVGLRIGLVLQPGNGFKNGRDNAEYMNGGVDITDQIL
ncbi:hypothetical protein D3C87_1825850 [compost metagenome]